MSHIQSHTQFEDFENLIAEMPKKRHLLIEYLHRFQDTYEHISSAHMQFLADYLKISTSEIYEVASFYHHFFIAEAADLPENKTIIQVCDSLPCQLKGSQALHEALENHYGDSVRIVHTPCVGGCDCAPAAVVGKNQIGNATIETMLAAIDANNTSPAKKDFIDYDAYCGNDGYKLLKSLIVDDDRQAIIDILKDSELKGLGGAGFPAGIKWQSVINQPKPKVVAVNIDEGEVGTFKDRYYLERNPHQFFEGTLIAAWVVDAQDIYIYIRNEYSWCIEILQTEIAKLKEKPPIENMPNIHLRRGAGAYVCGEITAMLESIEGKRGLPRLKPNKPYEKGLFQYPTLGHNFETLYWVPEILKEGADWFASKGINNCTGLRSYSISGSVNKPGVYVAPAGSTIDELIKNHAGGILNDAKLQGVFVGGSSGGLLPASARTVPLDFGTLDKYGCFIGSMALIVISEDDDMKACVVNNLKFLRDESCGQCTPCRVGTEKAVNLLEQGKPDIPLLNELCDVMQHASICGLGQAAPNPIRSLIKYFPEQVND